MLNKVNIAATLLLLTSAVILTASLAATAASTDSVIAEHHGGYIVKPHQSSGGSIMPMTIYCTISQGQTNVHSKLVSGFFTTLNIDLNWGNQANSLKLTIYTPDGYVLGPYYDSSDGVINGRINLDIYNSNGIAQGTWHYYIYGYRVAGQQSYYI